MVRAAVRNFEVPDEQTAKQAANAVEQLSGFLSAHSTPSTHVQLVPEDTDAVTTIQLPSAAFRLFIDVLAELANGNAVTVAAIHAELTSQQAADRLNVSRPFLIKLLDKQAIPYRRVGNRRKILLVDVLDYSRREEAMRRDVADELTREPGQIGLK